MSTGAELSQLGLMAALAGTAGLVALKSSPPANEASRWVRAVPIALFTAVMLGISLFVGDLVAVFALIGAGSSPIPTEALLATLTEVVQILCVLGVGLILARSPRPTWPRLALMLALLILSVSRSGPGSTMLLFDGGHSGGLAIDMIGGPLVLTTAAAFLLSTLAQWAAAVGALLTAAHAVMGVALASHRGPAR